MSMTIILYDEEEIERFEMPIEHIFMYVELIKKYGYESMDGDIYVYNYSQVNSALEFYIYLDRE